MNCAEKKKSHNTNTAEALWFLSGSFFFFFIPFTLRWLNSFVFVFFFSLVLFTRIQMPATMGMEMVEEQPQSTNINSIRIAAIIFFSFSFLFFFNSLRSHFSRFFFMVCCDSKPYEWNTANNEIVYTMRKYISCLMS